jgi:thiamine biosynthesis lipoprotein
LNGIAQGYSVDVVADYLKLKGVNIYVVEIGGELRMKGPKPDGTSLRIGIEGPLGDADLEPAIKHTLAIEVARLLPPAITGNFCKWGKRR